jgi:hypothetical protein
VNFTPEGSRPVLVILGAGSSPHDNPDDHEKHPPHGPHHVFEPHRIGGCRRELLDRTLIWNQAHLRQVLREYEIHHNQHRPHRSLHAAAPLKPLPEPVDLDHYRVRKQAHVAGLINEYRLVA